MTRKLAAIMFTDLVGYTTLMGKDSHAALELVRVSVAIQKALVSSFGGTWLKEMGDGVLVSFESAQDAVQCAIEIQKSARDELDGKLRIGIHLGDVIVQENDVYGDGVNIASRIESEADPGGIYISGSIAKAIRGQSDINTVDLGEFHLKNVDFPVQVFAVEGIGLPTPAKNRNFNNIRFFSNPLAILVGIGFIAIFLGFYYFSTIGNPEIGADVGVPVKENDMGISIAVLPFRNMSGDEALEPFCDGMTDAVISRLTKIEGIARVISRTSVMTYKRTIKSIPEIAKELNVSHLLQAGFQKAENDIKINLELIDGKSDDHFWSDDYTGEWRNIFEIQAEVAENVAKNLNVQLSDHESKLIMEPPTISKEAYDIFIQAEYQRLKSTESSSLNAISLYEEAIQLDTNFFDAYIGLATTWSTGGLVWGIFDQNEAWTEATKFFKKAQEIDPDNINMLSSYHSYVFYYEWNFEVIEEYLKNVKQVHENVEISGIATDYLVKTGRFKQALKGADQDILDDPSRGVLYFFKAEILFFLDRKPLVLALLDQKDQLYNDNWWYIREIARLYYYLGDHAKLKENTLKLLGDFTDRPPVIHWLAATNHYVQHEQEKVEFYLKRLTEQYGSQSSGSPAWFIAMYYCVTKDYEEAMEWLQKSYNHHEVEMTWLREEPLLRPLRGHPIYKDLYKKVGFDKVAPILPTMAVDF